MLPQPHRHADVPSSASHVLRVLSLGAGVQSTAVYLMALHGEIPPLDHAIFADVGDPARIHVGGVPMNLRTPLLIIVLAAATTLNHRDSSTISRCLTVFAMLLIFGLTALWIFSELPRRK